MIELPAILLAGVLGSSHCLGMCGGFALILGSTAHAFRANLVRQLVYTAGRVFSYAILGGVVGYAGWHLTKLGGSFFNAQSILALLAGTLLLVQGLFAAGALPRIGAIGEAGACLGAGAFASLLRSASLRSVFAAGIFNGLLPCGLVYAVLALAGSSGCLLHGAEIMATFGAGTAPAMILAGCGGSVLSRRLRGRVLRLAAWCVVLMGVLTIFRGATGMSSATAISGPDCVFCP